MQFFWGDLVSQNTPRGPFDLSLDWISACLSLDEADAQRILCQSDDEGDREDAETTLNLATRIRKHFADIFPSPSVMPTILFHDDLSQHNILVNEQGDLTAVLDWECVSAMPLWKACQHPALLRSKDRDEKPIEKTYGEDYETNDLYLEHMRVRLDAIAGVLPGGDGSD